jgi:hypothetical protein
MVWEGAERYPNVHAALLAADAAVAAWLGEKGSIQRAVPRSARGHSAPERTWNPPPAP